MKALALDDKVLALALAPPVLALREKSHPSHPSSVSLSVPDFLVRKLPRT